MSVSRHRPAPSESSRQRIRRIRDAARARAEIELDNENEQRHAAGERLVGGVWIAASDATRLQRVRSRRQLIAFVELHLLAIITLAVFAVAWRIFGFLFLPQVLRIFN